MGHDNGFDHSLRNIMQNQSLFFHLWCILRGSVWIWMKSNLFRFIEDYETHWGHAKNEFYLNEAM
jgi:hypothetical protein